MVKPTVRWFKEQQCLHVETNLGIINIRPNLKNIEGEPVNSIEIIPDEHVLVALARSNIRLILKEDKSITVSIEGFPDVKVHIKAENGRIHTYADDGFFQCWGVLSEDGELITNGNCITTNYLEVATVKALQSIGEKVKDKTPSPENRKIEVVN